jgi:hypothetical protein
MLSPLATVRQTVRFRPLKVAEEGEVTASKALFTQTRPYRQVLAADCSIRVLGVSLVLVISRLLDDLNTLGF